MRHILVSSMLLLGGLLWITSASGTVADGGGDEQSIDFVADVLPILRDRCFRCHGEEKQKGKLRLDVREGLFQGPDPDFPPVMPGDPDGSVLIERIELDADDPDRMPSKGEPLDESQIRMLRAWIAQGAPWQEPPTSEPRARRSAEDVADAIAGLEEAATPLPEDLDFNLHVRPILSDNCFRCHGPDGEHRFGDLRLDIREGAYSVIEPGDAVHSLLVDRITRTDPADRMPPPDADRTLDTRQKRILARWVDEGAQWRRHWSFVAPLKRDPPEVTESDWPRNAIDRFILARLDREGLTPNEEADRRTLLRRVTFDLTGLPPTPEEMEAFVADGADDAYEKVVDRLLASPRYGEHMARFWLDAARYGDTHGLHLDNYREMWPYRDWVVQAFNENLPYDRFAVEQLAGDLLPDPSLDQRIASGFNRSHVTTNEGGSIDEEVYVRNVVDRVSTTGTVFLGLSLGCAVCHDHKFDPIEQKEFYQLFAFFNNLDGKAMDGNAEAHPPVVQVPSIQQEEQMRDLSARIDTLERNVASKLMAVEYEEPNLPWPYQDRERRMITWVDDRLPDGAPLEGHPLEWVATPVYSGKLSMKRTGAGTHQHYFRNANRKLRVGFGDRLFAWVFLDPADPPAEIMLQFNSDGDSGWLHRAYWGDNRIEFGTDGSTERRRLGELPAAGVWTRLEVPVAAVGLAPGSVVHGLAFTQYDGTAYWDQAGIESRSPQEPEDFVWIDDELPAGAQPAGDGEIWQWVWGDAPPPASGRRFLRRSSGDMLSQDFFTGASPLSLARGDRLFAHVFINEADPPRSIQLQFNDGSWGHRVRWGDAAHGAGAEEGADFRAGDVPAAGRWVRLEVDPADVGLKPGAELNGWAFTQVGGTVYWDAAGVRTWSPPDDRHLHSQRSWEAIGVSDRSLPEPVRMALAVAPPDRDAEQTKVLRDFYVRYIHAGSRALFDPLEERITAVRMKRDQVDREIPTTLVMKERAEPRPAHLLKRGEYDARGEQVERKTPAALPPMAADLPRNRLGLARWLVDRSHPLTARVAVNRFWQQLFGTGLVRTSEDFGSQGEPPSHPGLLDWLAVRFVEDGWDVKQTMRRIVLSSTYRQSSRLREGDLERDPENRLLARGPRFRLDAEMLRDQALASSGLLVHQLGGPSVKPPQPDGLWFAVGYSSSNTAKFVPDQGPDRIHRRTLYTFIKRTAPPPQLSTFDAPSRESCTVRRERTNTPLQALLLMNDPQYVEAARHLARRVLREAGPSPESRVSHAYYLVLGRRPAVDDAADLLALYRDMTAEFRDDGGRASELAKGGDSDPAELAAWTMVANLILNLDEVVTRE